MTSIQAEIKGIKKQIQDQYSNVSGSDNQKSNNDSGWKELLLSVKNNTYQPKHINQTTRERYFNPNARILEDALESSFQYRICNNCGAPLALNTIMDHLENHCKGLDNDASSPNDLKREHTDDELESELSAKRKNVGSSVETFNGGRYNNEENSPTSAPDRKENSETPLKKQRKVKQRNPTEKHMIDFDKQCGVGLPEGGYCARSLTCKSHSMGAKRSVEGRSQPFDTLLAEYHKQHQTKIGAAAEKRAKQQEIQKQQKKLQREQKKQLQQQKQGQRGKKGNSSGNGTKSGHGGASSKNAVNASGSSIKLTPEEETTQVLNGVSRSFPLPLESTVLSSVRGRTKYFRMREMFASAFSVKPGYTSPGYGAIHSRVGCLDLDRTTDYKLRIRTPQPINQLPPQGLSPQQLQKLQQQRMLRAQMQHDSQLQQNSFQQHQRESLPPQPQQHGMQYNNVGSAPKPMETIPRPVQQQKSPEQNGLTPQEIQFQQQKLRQQQLQQQRFEAAAFHLANATKLMQGSNGEVNPTNPETSSKTVNSPTSVSTASTGQSLGSPVGGRVNVGIGNIGGRVN